MTSRNRLFAVPMYIGTLPICAAILVAGAWLASAGDLNPPAGPVSSTMKTLSEIEPRIAINATNTPGDTDSLFKITLPGSYYLTGNITGVVGKHGIEIASSGVTLDLNGYELLGAVGSLDGVSVTVFSLTNIAVVNGSVRSWGDEGVDLGSFTAANCRVEGVLSSGNAGNGITTGSGCTVSNCSAYANTNTSAGIVVGTACTLTSCSTSGNTANGITAAIGSTISNCSAYQNAFNGISTGSACTVTNCSAYNNTGYGITVALGSRVTNCSASTNTSHGINVTSGCTVADCTARLNTLDGIVCTSECVIRGNTCSFNGNGGSGAGIHATLDDNRIEGNNCTGADRGIDVDAAGNIIIKNTCSGNTTNWDIAIGNSVGPIVLAGTNAAVIAGIGPFPSTLGSTDPHANFSY